MRIPPYFGLAKEQADVFNKIINIIYPPAHQQKPVPLSSQAMVANNPFFLKQSTPQETQEIMEMITNYLTFKYMPTQHLMAFMVLKACTLKKGDLDLVF